jgi:hypothetical protein
MPSSAIRELEVVARPREQSVADRRPAQGGSAPSDAPSEDSPEVDQTLRAIQELLMRFPMATQAAFSALVAEGRAYAQTEEGAELLQQLTHSKRANRARVVWEILTLSGITDQRTQAVPSLFLDKIARTLVVERLEPLLSRLFDRNRG